ncbi:conserved hypothetical protein, partial [delta proteobacterium NaphS2]
MLIISEHKFYVQRGRICNTIIMTLCETILLCTQS